jgi:NitT/TauT family transport system substrate-binding protein
VRIRLLIVVMALWVCGQFAIARESAAQERIKIAYSADNSTNVIWYSALDTGIYKKYGLDVELIFIPSSTTTVLSVVAGDIQVANTSGGVVASAVVGGANLVLTACFINTLPYELIVNESIKLAEDLRGKNSVSADSAAPQMWRPGVLVRGLGLEPVKDVPILQVGGSSERASAFRTGRIAGFPSPPGIIHLAQGMPHRILISTADFKKRYDFPFICSVMAKNLLLTRRDTVKRITMALIETTHFLKTRKEESKKLIGKYARQYNPEFLEASYNAMVKLHDRVPMVTLEKSGFIEKIYR